jgi:hypothetical protein
MLADAGWLSFAFSGQSLALQSTGGESTMLAGFLSLFLTSLFGPWFFTPGYT